MARLTGRIGIRAGLSALLIAAAMLLGAPLAAGSTTFGGDLSQEPTLPTIPNSPNRVDVTVGGNFDAPVGGVLVSVQLKYLTTAGFPPGATATVRLLRFASQPAVGQFAFTNVGTDIVLPVPPTLGSTIAQASTRQPISAGDRLGFQVFDFTQAFRAEVATGGTCAQTLATNPPGTTTTYFANCGTRQLLLAGTIEPDADHDGFGDETQDGCPTNAAVQTACPATGQQGAALKKCKKKARKHDWSRKKLKKCKKKARLLPI